MHFSELIRGPSGTMSVSASLRNGDIPIYADSPTPVQRWEQTNERNPLSVRVYTYNPAINGATERADIGKE